MSTARDYFADERALSRREQWRRLRHGSFERGAFVRFVGGPKHGQHLAVDERLDVVVFEKRTPQAITSFSMGGHNIDVDQVEFVERFAYELRWRYTADGAIYATYCLPNATDAEFDEPQLSQAQVDEFAAQLRGAIFSRLARVPATPRPLTAPKLCAQSAD